MAPEDMDEAAWRHHVVAQFAAVNEQLSAGQACFGKIQGTLARIDRSTQLARDVQDVSKAAGLLYRTSSRFIHVVGKVIIYCGIGSVILYMLTHNGEVPEWGKPWLIFMEKVK